MDHPAPLSLFDIVRRHADRVVDEYPDDALEELATDLENDREDKNGLPIVLATATELRRRAAAGVRKWPEPRDMPQRYRRR
jgi:hypothetical protein